jgi:predicted nucleic acid-binding protein
LIVIDASAVVDALLGHAGLRERLAGRDLVAPEILSLEVSNAIRRLLAAGILDAVGAEDAVRALRGSAVEPFGHAPLLGRIWELRDRLTPYDAAYVALAEALDVPLVTRDRALAEAAGSRGEYFGPADYHRS